jgi:hypothetical protein
MVVYAMHHVSGPLLLESHDVVCTQMVPTQAQTKWHMCMQTIKLVSWRAHLPLLDYQRVSAGYKWNYKRYVPSLHVGLRNSLTCT